MNTATTFNDIQYAASICLKCGSCTYGDWPENHRLCSLYYRDECFTHGGGGFMSIVTALAENLLPFDKKIADLAYTCSGCLACDSRCSIIKNHPPKAEMIDMIRLLRYEAVKKGLAPKAVMKIRDSVKNGRGLALPKAGRARRTSSSMPTRATRHSPVSWVRSGHLQRCVLTASVWNSTTMASGMT